MNAPFDPAAIAAAAVSESTTSPTPKEKPRPITGADLLRMDIEPRQMLLAPYLPAAGSAMLYAPRGCGKTWVSLSLAYAVASGGAVLNGRAAAPARVLYIDGEMPLTSLQERLGAVAMGAQRNLPEDDFLQFLPADHYRDGLPDLASPEGRELVEELTEGVALVVFDNLSSLARYKENEADSWQPIQDLVLSLRRRGVSSLLVHHAGKSGQQRGTSRREDVLDTVIALRRPDEYEATEGARFHWHFEKARGFMGEDAAPFEGRLILEDGAARWEMKALTASRKEMALEMLAAGVKVSEVIAATGASRATVFRWKGELEGGGDGLH